MLALPIVLLLAVVSAGPIADEIANTTFNPVNEPPAAVDQTKGYLIQDHGNGMYFLSDGYYWSLAVLSTPISVRTPVYSSYGNNGNGNGYGYGNTKSSGGQRIVGYTTTTIRNLALVDAPTGNYNGRFINAVNEVMSITGANTVSHLIYSHQHTDHIGSSFQVLNAWPNVQIIAHELVAKRLADRKDSRRPVPTFTYDGNYNLPQFDLYLTDALNDAHAPGNTIIYSRSRRVIMAVDIVFPGWMPFEAVAETEYLPQWYAGHKVLRAFEWDTIVAGHVTRPGTRADLDVAIEYNNDLLNASTYALAAVDAAEQGRIAGLSGVFDPTSPSYGNAWKLFRAIYEAIVEVCVDSMTQKGWGSRLAAFDVWITSHCVKATESVRID